MHSALPPLKRVRRSLLPPVLIGSWLSLSIAGLVHAAVADELDAWPNFDIRYDAGAPKSDRSARTAALGIDPADRPGAEQRLRERVGRVSFSYDPVFETPRFIRSTSNFLVEADPGNPRDPEQVALDFLTEFSGLFLVQPDELSHTRVVRNATSTVSAARNIRYQQQIAGVDVFGAQFRATVTAEGHLLNASSLLLDSRLANFDPQQPQATATTALIRAAGSIGVFLQSQPVLVEVGDGPTRKHTFATSPDFWYPPTAELTYFPMSPFEVRVAWEVLIPEKGTLNLYRIIIDATNLQVLYRVRLTQQAGTQTATYRVYTSDSPAPLSPFPPSAPRTFQAPVVERRLLALVALDDEASPNGWIDDGDNTTSGNNVEAMIDRDFTFTPDEPIEGSPSRVFDFPLSLSNSPKDYRQAACVNLFYWCNVIHDRFYQLGFDEASGNFQMSNFGRGGLGHDPVLALCQAGADFGFANNAFFVAFPEGSEGIMAMFVYTGPTPDRDGSLDAGIIIHEYTHGLSWRLHEVLGTSQSDAMGEGWSDFYSLCLLAEPGDDANGIYAHGGYSDFELLGLDFDENYYFGVRRYPYSTDMTINPLTFEDIDPTKIDLPGDVPLSPVWEGLGTALDAAEVHNAGEVWCVTLWDCRANIVAREGFAGNDTMLKIVTEAMKISPPSPHFLEARDAIIQADIIVTGGKFFNELWDGFAKRGMGFSAFAPASNSNMGVIEASDLPHPMAAARATARSGPAPLTVTFRGVAENLAQADRHTTWSFGTGEAVDQSVADYTYNIPGSYLAVFEASDVSGVSARASVSIEVLGKDTTSPGMQVQISASPMSGPVPLTVTFTATASGAAAAGIVSWSWSFGDGTGATGQSVQHTYTQSGSYLVTMTATDTGGAKMTRALQVTTTLVGAEAARSGSSTAARRACGLIGLPVMFMLTAGMFGLAVAYRRRA